tara:strand:- start:9955 stop:11154 length:1200 start_codon:yes stop_codon:yes gene_type:complete
MTLSINKLIFSLGFFIILLNGLWEFVGLPTFLVKISFFTILLFVSLVVAAKRKFYVSSFEFYLAFMIIIFFLCTYFMYPNIGTLVSFFQIFSPVFIVLLLFIISRNYSNSKFYSRLLLTFFILQMIAVSIKLLFVGQNEGLGIGTLSLQAGSLSTFIGAFMCIYAMHVKEKGLIAIHFIILFSALFFVLVNEKRLGTLIVIFFVLYTSMSSSPGMKNFISTRVFKFVFGAAIAIVFFILGTTLIPTILDTYAITELDQRIWSYLTATHSDGRPIGRLAGLFQAFIQLVDENRLLIGMGPESLLFSNVTNTTMNVEFNPIGLTVVLSRFGIIGIVLMSCFFYYLFKIAKGNFVLKIFALYILLDFLIYSNSLFLSYSLVLLFIIFCNYYQSINNNSNLKI